MTDKKAHKGTRKKLAVLVSGGGSNMQAVLDAINAGKINGSVEIVISSNPTAYALKRAAIAGIEVAVLAKNDYDSAAARDEKLLFLLKKYDVDFVLLAGYLGIVSSDVVAAYPNKIINIHPALLPAYGGKNCYGLNVHQAVVAAKEPFSGATVHFVDAGTDTGLIIAQESLPVSPLDTAESLQEKILKTIEHKLFPQVVAKLCDGKIFVQNGKVIVKP